LYRSGCSDENPNHQGVCPNGWHLPTVADFNELATAVGGTAATIPINPPWTGDPAANVYVGDRIGAGAKLKSTSTWNAMPGTDDFDFNAKAGGYGAFSGGGTGPFTIYWTGTHAIFWTADEAIISKMAYLSPVAYPDMWVTPSGLGTWNSGVAYASVLRSTHNDLSTTNEDTTNRVGGDQYFRTKTNYVPVRCVKN